MERKPKKKKNRSHLKASDKVNAESNANTALSNEKSTNNNKNNSFVRLNIGGVKYCTTAYTLTHRGPNFFSSLLDDSSPLNHVKDEEGSYFIDRDGEYFQPILSFLRCGELRIPHGMSRGYVEREAEFYLIDIYNTGIVFPLVQSNSSTVNFVSKIPQLRRDGVYVQSTAADEGDVYAYYRFTNNNTVQIMCTRIGLKCEKHIGKMIYEFEIIENRWVMIRSCNPRKKHTIMTSIEANGELLRVLWRYDFDSSQHAPSKNLAGNTFRFFPSCAPILGFMFSNESVTSRLRKRQCHRLLFKDFSNVVITVVEREKRRIVNTVKRTATYHLDTQDHLTRIIIQDDFFPESGIICLGTMLFENRVIKQSSVKTWGINRSNGGHIDMCKVYFAIQKQDEDDGDEDEMDVYEFLRTSAPPNNNVSTSPPTTSTNNIAQTTSTQNTTSTREHYSGFNTFSFSGKRNKAKTTSNSQTQNQTTTTTSTSTSDQQHQSEDDDTDSEDFDPYPRITRSASH